MATTTRAMMGLSASSIGFRAANAARRGFATSRSQTQLLTRARPSSRILLDKSKLQQQFRRGYADVAPVKTVKPKRFRWLLFLWRATYLSALGGIGYLSYGVWDLRHPDDQFEPDPTKKNLVILGMCLRCLFLSANADILPRYWMGCCLPSQEARYRKLQCYCYLTPKLLPLHTSPAIMYNRYRRTSIHYGAYPKHNQT